MSAKPPLSTLEPADRKVANWVSHASAPANPLRDQVKACVEHYLAQLEGAKVTGVYDMVLAELEAPLLHLTLEYVKQNQTRAAALLGLNRGTLRTKMKHFGLLHDADGSDE